MAEEDVKMNEENENNAAGTSLIQTTQTRVQDLFGGAFKIGKFPATYRDISDLVPVNDNQEVFSDVNESNPAYSGNQLIIEILERTEKEDVEAIEYNFKDLAETQGGIEPHILSQQHFTSGVQVKQVMPNVCIIGCQQTLHLLKGTQKIFPTKKTHDTERDFVTMLMCLLRLKEPFNTDILITLNVPDKYSDD